MNYQAQLFPSGRESLHTEGIKYAGSKLKLLPKILEVVENTSASRVLDGFSGTTRVSQALAQSGFEVISSDISEWSYVFGKCYLCAEPKAYYAELIQHLNNTEPTDGWFTANYGGTSCNVGDLKHPWQIHNTRKLDGIRQEIDEIGLDEIDKSVALSSLMLALDKVDNTLGHFTSYLKEWSPRSYNNLELKVPRLFPNERHEVVKGDIFDILKNREFDLAYFDPPYGSNNERMPSSRVRYASYYHLWTTVCLNDRPKLFGAARRREDTRDRISGSVFEEFRRGSDGSYMAVSAIRRLLKEVKADHIILSYSSGGRATAEELMDAIEDAGKLVDILKINHKRNVMTGMRWTHEWVKESAENVEFIFHIEKD